MRKRVFILLLFSLIVFSLVGCESVDDIIKDNFKNEQNTNDPQDRVDEKDEGTVISQRLARLYFFDTTKSEVYYIDKNINVTDENLAQALNLALEENTYSENFVTMSKEAELDSVAIDNNTGVLTVKFKNNFFSKMDIGDISESGFYSALITTYAYNYGVDKVALYQDNELYTGMRGELPEGYNTVSFANIKEFTKEEYEANKVEEKKCRVFYYTAMDDKMYYVDTTIQVTGKAVVTALTNALKTPPNDEFFNFANDVNVRSATLDTENKILTVDFGPEYYNIMTRVGSGSEAGALRSLAYTYGYNYGVDKVIIKVDGENYAGGHIAYEDGEYITVDTTEVSAFSEQ